MHWCSRGFHDNYDKGRSRSRSPAGWGDRHRTGVCDRSWSRSAERYDNGAGRQRSPTRSFHEVGMKRDWLSPSQQRGPLQNN